jgi:hypothetical protein
LLAAESAEMNYVIINFAMLKASAHIFCDIPYGIKLHNVGRTAGTFRLYPKKHTSKQVDTEQRDKGEPGYLEHCRSKVDDCYVLQSPASKHNIQISEWRHR